MAPKKTTKKHKAEMSAVLDPIQTDSPTSIALKEQTFNISKALFKAKINNTRPSKELNSTIMKYLENLKTQDTEILTPTVAEEILKMTSKFLEIKDQFDPFLKNNFKNTVETFLRKYESSESFTLAKQKTNEKVVEIYGKFFKYQEYDVAIIDRYDLRDHINKLKPMIKNKYFLSAEAIEKHMMTAVTNPFAIAAAKKAKTYALFEMLSENQPLLLEKSHIEKAIKTLKIDIGQDFIGCEDMATYIANLSRINTEQAKEMLDYFIEYGMDINSKFLCYNITAQLTRELQKQGNHPLLEVVKHLLNTYSVDTNIALKLTQEERDELIVKEDSVEEHIEKPSTFHIFSLIVGIYDLDLALKTVDLFLDYGTKLNSDQSPIKYSFMHNFMSPENYPIHEDDMIEHMKKVYFDIERLLELKLSRILHDAIEEYSLESETDETRTHKEFATESTLQQYISLKEISTESTNLNLSEEEILKNKFDLLLLRYIQTPDNDTMANIKELLDNNADLQGYCISAILQETQESAQEILCCNQNLMRKFFELKKAQNNKEEQAKMDDNSKEPELASGVYKIITNFGDAFFRIAGKFSDLTEQVKEKLLKIGFIKNDSVGKNGIKMYDNYTAKLKLDAADEGFYATKTFTYNGEKMIIFDRLCNHNKASKLINDTKLHKLEITEPAAHAFKYLKDTDFYHLMGLDHNADDADY